MLAKPHALLVNQMHECAHGGSGACYKPCQVDRSDFSRPHRRNRPHAFESDMAIVSSYRSYFRRTRADARGRHNHERPDRKPNERSPDLPDPPQAGLLRPTKKIRRPRCVAHENQDNQPTYRSHNPAQPNCSRRPPRKLDCMCARRNHHTGERKCGRRLDLHLNAVHCYTPGREVELMEKQSECLLCRNQVSLLKQTCTCWRNDR